MSGRPLSWPTWGRLATGIRGGAWVALVFFPVYLGCAALTRLRDSPWRLYADWELNLPFVPVMVIPYLSLFVLFVLPPFQLDERELRALTHRLIGASLAGGLIFLALPAQMGFGRHDDAQVWQPAYDAIYKVDGPYNTVPSFHVLYATSILLAMAQAATPPLRWAYRGWIPLVCGATVLTHRHHLLDVATGLALAVLARRLYP